MCKLFLYVVNHNLTGYESGYVLQLTHKAWERDATLWLTDGDHKCLIKKFCYHARCKLSKYASTFPRTALRLHNGKESVAFVFFSNIFCGYLSTCRTKKGLNSGRWCSRNHCCKDPSRSWNWWLYCSGGTRLYRWTNKTGIVCWYEGGIRSQLDTVCKWKR